MNAYSQTPFAKPGSHMQRYVLKSVASSSVTVVRLSELVGAEYVQPSPQVVASNGVKEQSVPTTSGVYVQTEASISTEPITLSHSVELSRLVTAEHSASSAGTLLKPVAVSVHVAATNAFVLATHDSPEMPLLQTPPLHAEE